MKKPASAAVSNRRQPLPSSQLQLVRGGGDPIVVLPNPSLKSERVQ